MADKKKKNSKPEMNILDKISTDDGLAILKMLAKEDASLLKRIEHAALEYFKEEKEILTSFENDEWKEIPNMDTEIKKHVEYAKATHRKDKRVNIRISQKDLESVQRKALEEGIPYQTLVASLIHKYINGKLIEKDKVLITK